MTVEIQPDPQQQYLRLRLSDRLTADDYARFVPVVDEWIHQHSRARLLVEFHDFQGWTAGAMWQDLKFGISHFTKIERIAIVGERGWQRGLAAFCKPFTMARVRYFDVADIAEAEAWLAEGSDRPHAESFEIDSVTGPLAEHFRALASEDGRERERARAALVAAGEPAVEPLQRAARGGHQQLRLEATRGLAELRLPGTERILAQQFDDTPEIAWAAAEGLSRMGRAGAIAVLEQVIADPDSHGGRVAAHHALRNLTDNRVRAIVAPALEAFADGEPRSAAVVAAQRTLKELRSEVG